MKVKRQKMSGCGCELEVKNNNQKRILMILLGINAFMFFVEFALGLVSESTALIADSLDMLADAAVYGIGFYAVGKATSVKIKAARISGVFQIILGATVFIDVLRRLVYGSDPASYLMVSVGTVALIANVICLSLISKERDGEVHMRASWIFSKNDVIANLATILAGVLVFLLGSRFPDILIGLAISVLVIRGGIHIVRDAENEKNKELEESSIY